MGKKFIIELPENTHWIQWLMEGTEDHHPYMDFKSVEDLTPYTEPDMEKEEQIQVGDEVRNIENKWTAVVCNIEGECMTLMDTNGALGDGYDVNRFTKTGRHFPEIAAVLAKMKEES